MRFRTMLGTIVTAGVLAGCGGGGDLLLPGAGEPATVTLIQGDDQNGRVGEALPQLLVAAVTDGAGRPVEGARVVFVLSDPSPGAAVAPDTSITDADGHAAASVVLGTQPGTQAGEVRALGARGIPTATVAFSLTAVSTGANGIRAVSGEDQSAPVGSALPNSLVVEVADGFGNPIPGVQVSWTVDGGGTLSEAQTTTGEDGRTAVQRTLGPAAGTQRTLATVEGLAGSPVTFVHRATAGSASGVSIVSGDDQTGPISAELPGDLVVQVRDSSDNPVPGIPVTWVIGSGGGGITPSTSTTDAEGRTSATWTLGGVPGPNTVSAVVSGIGVAEFSATATAGAPARLAIRTQPSATVVSGAVLAQQPAIQLLDSQGNDARQAGVTITASIATGGGTLGGGIARLTDANGRVAYTDLSLAGAPGTRTLRFTASGFSPVTSAQVVLTAAPTVTGITSDAPDPSRAGELVTVQFTVTSSAGTPTGSVRVQDGGDECTGALTGGQGSCTIVLTNVGTRTLTAGYQGQDGFGSSNGTEGHVVTAPLTPALVLRQAPTGGTVGVPLDPQPAVQLQDGEGNDVAQAGVSVSGIILTGGGTLIGQTTVTTDASGRATFSDLAVDGVPGTRTLNFSAGGFTAVNSDPIDISGVPTITTIGSDEPEPSPVNTPVSVSYTVTFDGSTPVPSGRVVVTDGVDSCDGDVAEGAGSCSVTLTTVGARTLMATYQPAGQFAGSSATAPHTVE